MEKKWYEFSRKDRRRQRESPSLLDSKELSSSEITILETLGYTSKLEYDINWSDTFKDMIASDWRGVGEPLTFKKPGAAKIVLQLAKSSRDKLALEDPQFGEISITLTGKTITIRRM